MFERYTEHARRIIFFARYETSQFGSEEMEPEHFLLALFREAPILMKRLVPDATGEMVREQIQRETPPRPKIPASVDLPLSHTSKRVLACAAEEADRLGHRHIGTEHMLLGLLREPTLAARILETYGVTLENARQEISKSALPADPTLTPEQAEAEREALRALITSLPDEALGRARAMLEHARMPRVQPSFEPRVRPGTGFVGSSRGGFPEGHFSSASMESGTLICETRRFHKGHQITLIEKLRMSEDGTTLNYSQELRGPKGEHHWSMDFDLT